MKTDLDSKKLMSQKEISPAFKSSKKIICDNVPPLPMGFQAERYMGKWYQLYHSKNQRYQDDSWACTTAEYSGLDSKGNFQVHNTSKAAKGGIRFGLKGKAKCPADSAPGHCFVSFTGKSFKSEPNYNIVHTDYDNYSIVYSCGDDFQDLFILSREPDLYEDLEFMAFQTMEFMLPNYDWSKTIIKDNQDAELCGY